MITRQFVKNLSAEISRRNLKDADIMRPDLSPETAAAIRCAIITTPGMTQELASKTMGLKPHTLNSRLTAAQYRKKYD